MIERQCKTLGAYGTNAYLLLDRDSGEAILIDAPAEADSILDWAEPYRVKFIFLTHAHADHVGALEEVRRELDVPVFLHPADSRAFQLKADQMLEDGQTLTLGAARLQVVHVPGHTEGSVVLQVIEPEGFNYAIVGDAIFPGGPGHTTSSEALKQSLDSLARTVFTWSDEVELHPGHGEPTTVGEEREAFDAFRSKPLPDDLFGDVTWR